MTKSSTKTPNAILGSPDGKNFLLTNWHAATDIPPGYYTYDLGMFGCQFMRREVSGERIQEVNESQKKLFEAIQAFWTKKDRYLKMGVRHRLAVMMHGKPGTGKTVTMRKAINDTIAGGGYALAMDNLSEFTGAVNAIRALHPNAPILGACEDMDSRFTRRNMNGDETFNADMEERWTHLLDGIESELDGVLIVASTNNIHKFSDRLLRPGRFDIKCEIAPPSKVERIKFIAELWDVQRDHQSVVKLAEESEGMVIAEIKSLAVRLYIDGLPDYAPVVEATAPPSVRIRKAAQAASMALAGTE